jgi:GT2 family glycosyltransferase
VVSRRRALSALEAIGETPGWRHLLALMLARRGSTHHAHVPMLLCHRGTAVSDEPGLAAEAVQGLLDSGAHVEQSGRIRRVRRPIRGGEPSVEVIVCFRDRPKLLARCVVSLLARTEYDNVRLALVDNGSLEAETAELLENLSRRPRVRVLRDARPFNFAALNNLAARSSSADALVFLNNDTEVVTGDWIEALLEEALRPEVGSVAPMLLYPDGAVQHAGAALGLHGYAGHPFAGLLPDAPTPFGFAAEGTRNWLAVTAACMMVERSKFEAVGGFDETFIVAGNDVDLCLRLTAAGHRSVCVPHALLVHDESRSRGTHIDPADFVTSERSYGDFRIVGDPFYNPNLTLRLTDCGVRAPGEAIG